MRSRSRRSFAVEVKSGGRRNATVIPTRVASPAAPSPRPMPFLSPEPTRAVEKRRILPSLIAPEPPPVEPEPMPAAEDRPPHRRRGRPRKLAPAPAERGAAEMAVVESISAEPVVAVPGVAMPVADAAAAVLPAPAPAPQARSDRAATAKRTVRPGAALAPGERWKRRLGRWSR